MKRGSIITIIGFWLILISILSIPDNLQDALVIASAIGLVILSFTVEPKKDGIPSMLKRKQASKNTRDIHTEPKAKETPARAIQSPSPESEFDQIEEISIKPPRPPQPSTQTARPSDGSDTPHHYQDQGVNVTLRNDL